MEQKERHPVNKNNSQCFDHHHHHHQHHHQPIALITSHQESSPSPPLQPSASLLFLFHFVVDPGAPLTDIRRHSDLAPKETVCTDSPRDGLAPLICSLNAFLGSTRAADEDRTLAMAMHCQHDD
jgi:hypothetical protein